MEWRRGWVIALCGAVLLLGRTSESGEDATAVASPTVSGTPSPTPTLTPTSTPAVTSTPRRRAVTPTVVPEPYRVTFAAGEVIDVSPAVVFGDLETGEAEAWVIPGAVGEFAVSPGGGFVIYLDPEEGYSLLRADDLSVRTLQIGEWPIEFGPGDSGFVARDIGLTVPTIFDGHGEAIADAMLIDRTRPVAAAWSTDGDLVALSQASGLRNTMLMLMWDRGDAAGEITEVLQERIDGGHVPALEWSPDSELLALVMSDSVRAFNREGEQVWTVEGDFSVNPRWSADGQYLTVFAWSLVVGRDGGDAGLAPTTYLIDRDGNEVLRFAAGGLCGGDPWLDTQSFVAAGYRVGIDGSLAPYDGVGDERWAQPAELGFEVTPFPGYHWAHLAARDDSHRLDDGRLVFTTGNLGHGGCGEGDPPSEWPAAEVEWPPYGPVRAAPEE